MDNHPNNTDQKVSKKLLTNINGPTTIPQSILRTSPKASNQNKKVRFKNINKRTRTKNKKHGNRNADMPINVMYVNANGITGKMPSLTSAAIANDSHIVAVTETKTNTAPPALEGYTWEWKNRKGEGGGVAIAIRDDLRPSARPVQNIETEDQEIVWIEIQMNNTKLHIGVYYGKQEGTPVEIIEREYAQLTTQINTLKQKGEIILIGDFNAKLQVDKPNANQQISTNGRHLKNTIDQTDLVPISIYSDKGTWTRVNRNNPNERSVIDYTITTPSLMDNVIYHIIDEEGKARIKGRKETDHNTFLMAFRRNIQRKTTRTKKWKLKNKEGWENFNKVMTQKVKTNEPTNYEELVTTIHETLHETIGTVTVKTGAYKYPENPETKALRNNKRETRKEFERADPTNKPLKKAKLDKYLAAQAELRSAIEEQERSRVTKQLQELIEGGGTKSQKFWDIRRRLTKGNTTLEYDVMTEEGTTLEDPDEAKEHIAQYFENLYQAREGTPEYTEWTEKIKDEVTEIEEGLADADPPAPITADEMNAAIKSTKEGKSCGPDNLPNEIFTKANQTVRNIYRDFLNRTLTTNFNPPGQWQKGEILRLYKGKGTKGKCSNERGITLASNFGKLLERIINNRANKTVEMSEAQAGGKKGRATVDHIIVLRDLIKIETERRNPVYLVFLDVTKAYDKAWLDAIMYVMHKRGINDNLWTVIKKLNENLTATVRTKHGNTREIKIKDSIRQGGVLSVLQYALLMDEIAKAIKERNLGIEIPGTNEKVGCLLWMDDVVLSANNPKDLQEMLDITNDIANRYHLKFGNEKSKVMKIGRRGPTPEFNLGEMKLDYCDKYKYLGLVVNNRNNLQDQIRETKGKAEAAIQTLFLITGDNNFKGIEMESTWKLLETCVNPIITYGGETWEPNKKETSEMNRILDNIIKRILMTPVTTPREALYIETGLLDVQHTVMKNRINTDARLERNGNNLIRNILNTQEEKGWKKQTDKMKQELDITQDDISGGKSKTKITIKKKIMRAFKDQITSSAQEKSKIRHLLEGRPEWKPGTKPAYMNKLNRRETSLIFKARTRMLDIKNNFRGKYKDTKCRNCNQTTETQEHILEECKEGDHITLRVRKWEIFTDNVIILKNSARKINIIMENLEKYHQNRRTTRTSAAPPNGVEQPGRSGKAQHR